MADILLACNTLKSEILLVAERCGRSDLEMHWLRSDLHDSPELLRGELQREMDGFPPGSRVLLGFGSCGNAMLGVESKEHTLVLPKMDDCITLLLGGRPERARLEHDKQTYYMTPAWLDSKHSLHADYRYSLRKYGETMTRKIFSELLSHYAYLGLIQTDACDFPALVKNTRPVAQTLGLRQLPVCGTLRYLTRLLSGKWDSDSFLIVPPHTRLTADMLFF